jgi:hypothetical protein
MRLIILLTVFILLSSVELVAQAPLISLHDGKLVYNKYANRGQQDSVNRIPDFSNAGYKGGGIIIPTLAVKETVEPVEGDCRALIQEAIDRVAALPADANGQRGAVLLKAGVYPVEGSLFIRSNGVVLRGEGNGLTGTVLIATQKVQHNLIVVQGTGSGYAEVSGSRVKIATPYVPTGAKTFAVADNHSFQPGDNVVIQKTPTEAWIDTLDMRQFGWTASAYRSTYERKVQSVQGNTITLDIPIVDPLEQFYGGGDVFKSAITGRIQESGVENMRIESFFANNDDESHGWNAVVLNRAENCWVRNVIVKFFGYAAVNTTNMSRFNTVEDCAMIDPKSVTTGGRKYSFIIDGNATNNLFQRCMTWGGRHDYVTGSKVPGPNVFLDCISENTFADIGPHHRWGTGQLYDNVYGGQIRVQNRGASGSGHGWSGAQILFWNCHSFKSDIEVESPPTAINWGIGCVGVRQTNTGYWESWGTHVLPRSLYLQQLEERLGTQAVVNITTPDQLQGTLRDLLRSRAVQISTEPKVAYGEEPPPSDSFDITDNGGTITAQYSNTTKPAENFPSVIDNSTTTKYYQSGRKALWVQYQSSVTAVVVKYTITSANDVPERDPKNWLLLASNDGLTWDTLDTRTGETFATRFLTKTYTFENTTSYSYYRLSIISNNGHSGTQFAEWELHQRKHQTISLGDIPDMTYGDEPVELVASATSGLPVALEIVNGPATLDEGFLTITGAGVITVRATQVGDERYFPADTVEKSFTVRKAAQGIAFDPVDPKTYGDAPFEVSATVDTGLPITFEVIAGPASISASTLTITGAGSITIRAVQAGNENYEPATAVQTFEVQKAVQTITFEAISPKKVYDEVTLVASASSGLPVLFDIIAGPGILAGNILSFTGEGIVTVEASHPGNENYLAASTVEQTVLADAPGFNNDGIKLVVAPNPTRGKSVVIILDHRDRQYSFTVYNNNGSIVVAPITPRHSKVYELDLSAGATGIYYLLVTDATLTTVTRILKW